MNTPQPLNLYTHIPANLSQPYQIDLLSAPATEDANAGFGSLSPISDSGYAGKVTYQEGLEDDGAGKLLVTLAPVFFDASHMSTDVVVEAYSVALVFDDGLALIGTFNFEEPVPFGPNTEGLALPVGLEIEDLSAIPLNWS